MAAMSLGIHVYVQKPLAHTITESRMLAKAAKKYNVKTQSEGDRESPVLRPS